MTKSKIILSSIIIVVLAALVIYDNFIKVIEERATEISEELEHKKMKLAKYSTLLAMKNELEKEASDKRSVTDIVKDYIVYAKTPALAAADIQNIIQPLITSRGGSISRMNVKQATELKPFQLISLEIDANVPDVSVLADVIYDIETHKPMLHVKKLDIRVVNFTAPVELFLNMEVTALSK